METVESTTTQQNLAIRLLRVLRYNKARIERCVSLLPDQHKPLFHVIPFLLHVNESSLPGYVESKDVPYGLHNFTLRPDIVTSLGQLFPHHGDIPEFVKRIWPKKRCIESVLLMGSVGTIAQEHGSDFDYWLCIDSAWFSERELNLLQQKATKIEQWAMNSFGLEVHFFISDIKSVRNNDFGIADGESAGSAQAVVLKAEFYSTNIVVAGKAPFWWLTADNASDEEYEATYHQLKQGVSPDPSWVMDLGNLHKMDPNELFGAAIWQLSKAMDSPFKSVLKMAKLEVFLENLGTQQPLCNILKKRVHHTDESAKRIEPVDPYALMFDHLIEHYEQVGNDSIVDLLQECFYIKCQSRLSDPVDLRSANFKHRIMSAYVMRWGWSEEKITRLDNIDTWTFSEQVALSRRIHSFLIKCYRRMSEKFKRHRQSVSKEDMTVLGRRLSTFYAKSAHKIDFLRSSFGNELYCSTVTIKTIRSKAGRQWLLYSGEHLTTPKQEAKAYLIRSDNSTVPLIAWAVINKIIDRETNILLDYEADPVTEVDLKQLTLCISTLFPPLKVNAIPREQLLKKRKIEACLAVANYESSRLKAEVDEIAIVYSTSWGERFVEYGQAALKRLTSEMVDQDVMPQRYLVVPEYTHKKRLIDHFLEKTDLPFELM
ncbi:adenylate cyclase [Alteromonas sediminis]|uniref:Adenylate cyclase n=1 Tax=Alteromonas sediminis TaxID=2259342 RepID=A0A3N5Z563_9ALTE|nr:class I adenylate cyclase [Alteromonas sediminis]RPJ65384.1 adenylate cyclase [Alteromonas sediminis]